MTKTLPLALKDIAPLIDCRFCLATPQSCSTSLLYKFCAVHRTTAVVWARNFKYTLLTALPVAAADAPLHLEDARTLLLMSLGALLVLCCSYGVKRLRTRNTSAVDPRRGLTLLGVLVAPEEIRPIGTMQRIRTFLQSTDTSANANPELRIVSWQLPAKVSQVGSPQISAQYPRSATLAEVRANVASTTVPSTPSVSTSTFSPAPSGLDGLSSYSEGAAVAVENTRHLVEQALWSNALSNQMVAGVRALKVARKTPNNEASLVRVRAEAQSRTELAQKDAEVAHTTCVRLRDELSARYGYEASLEDETFIRVVWTAARLRREATRNAHDLTTDAHEAISAEACAGFSENFEGAPSGFIGFLGVAVDFLFTFATALAEACGKGPSRGPN